MLVVKRLVLALAVLLAADGMAGAAGGPATRPHAKTAIRARPTAQRQVARRRAVKRSVAPRKLQARSSAIVSRPTPLELTTPAERRNSAPTGATEAERALQQKLDAIMGSPYLKSAINGVYVVDARTGRELYAYAADRQLNPASNTKLISTATALSELGPDYTYTTRLYGPEPDAQGVVHGDLILVGSGDPTLRAAHLAEMVGELKERGVSKITGDIVISKDERDGLALPYVRVTVTGGSGDGDLAHVRLHPDSGLFVIDNRARTGAVKKKRARVQVGAVQVTGNGSQLRISVSGKIRRGQELKFVRGVPRPVLFTAHTLRASLLNAGIEVSGNVRQEDQRPEPAESNLELATHDSVPLSRLAAMINKPSDNFLADRVIMTVGAEKYGGDRSMQKGVRAMGEWLGTVGIEDGSYKLENGSGLSHMIHVSARQIATVLLHGAKDEGIGKDWIDSLAVGGVDGTLRSRFAGHPVAGHVRGKTGTLSGVSALSGFVTLTDDDSICFSVLTSGFGGKRKGSVRQGQALVADAIFDYLRARGGDQTAAPSLLAAPPAVAPDIVEAAAPAAADEGDEGDEGEGHAPLPADSEDVPAPGDIVGNPDVEL